jgi:hypothetical protein
VCACPKCGSKWVQAHDDALNPLQGGTSDAGANPEAQELPGAAAAALLALYRERAPDKVPLVEALLKRQGLV